MNGLRNVVFGALSLDATLNGFGFTASNIYPTYAATTSPAESRFLVIRWGTTAPGIGGARPVDTSFWVYDREPDYTVISDVLKRLRVLLPTLPGSSTGDGGWILGVDDQGDSPDLYDDAWERFTRNGAYRITASGI